MNERGPYRSAFESLADDPDFQNLSPLAQAIFWTLKLKLGQYGIAVFYVSTLTEMHRRTTPKAIAAALKELEQPKRVGAEAWIRRDGHVVWLVNGLKFEPSITIENKNHRSGALRYVKTLPRCPLLSHFIAYYNLDGMGGGSHPPSHPDGIPDAIGAAKRVGRNAIGMGGGITDTDTERDTERETETDSSSVGERLRLLDRLTTAVDKHAVSMLLDRVPLEVAWTAELHASLDAMGGHAPLTAQQLGEAVRDYMANGHLDKPNMRHFRAYLSRMATAPARPSRPAISADEDPLEKWARETEAREQAERERSVTHA